MIRVATLRTLDTRIPFVRTETRTLPFGVK